ncbi:MAG: ergothioneine biosynthesis protein EgtB [Planctomycetota bacterium]
MSAEPKASAARRPAEADRKALAAQFRSVRAQSDRLTASLAEEDLRAQSMEDVSPPYWNLGHTSWFFAANLLRRFDRMPRGFNDLDYPLNSYYEGLGPRLERSRRGSVTTPTTKRVGGYRQAVDDAVLDWLAACPADQLAETSKILRIGCEHERQHQELFLTEIHHIRWSDPTGARTAYAPAAPKTAKEQVCSDALRAVTFDAGDTMLGHQERSLEQGGFCWDNELPAHRACVGAYALGDRLVTNREWLAFVEDGGYRDPLLWLSNGWQTVCRDRLEAPLYWLSGEDGYARFSLRGWAPLDLDAPACNVSFYEADAFARWFGHQHDTWRGARLPREIEWEHAARQHDFERAGANLLGDDVTSCRFDVEPAPPATGGLRQLRGTAWEWTVSHYEPYPGYRPYDGALTEYNGKFMDNQRVLRGGSFATPRAQARVAYRNFWPADTRFQASGGRLCVER